MVRDGKPIAFHAHELISSWCFQGKQGLRNYKVPGHVSDNASNCATFPIFVR